MTDDATNYTVAILIGGPSAGRRFRMRKHELHIIVNRPNKMIPVLAGPTVNTGDIASIEQDTYTARYMRFTEKDGVRDLILYGYEKLSDWECQKELLNCYAPYTDR